MVHIDERTIGEGSPTYIVFEAGPTHSGVASAKRLVEVAASAGADAIKFQIQDPNRLVGDPAMMVSYGVLADRASERIETVEEPLLDVLRRRALTWDEWRAVKEHADVLGVTFFATVGFEDELEFLMQLGCPSIKIASLDLNLYPLLRAAARHDVCVQIDTGNGTIGEVEKAVDVLTAEGSTNLIIHHCPSGYPARLTGVNLRVISTLRQMFEWPVGFSDHSPGWDMDIAAVALGANLLEKTITEDRITSSPEHVMSLEPHDAARFVTAIRNLEVALGHRRRILTSAEATRRAGRRRAAVLPAGGGKGIRVADLTIDYARPGDGVTPEMMELLGQARLRGDLAPGARLRLSDFEWSD